MRTLTEREKKLLTLRYGLENGQARTQESVAEEFGITRERVRQIEAKVLKIIRVDDCSDDGDFIPDASRIEEIKSAMMRYDIENDIVNAMIGAASAVLSTAYQGKETTVEKALWACSDKMILIAGALCGIVNYYSDEVLKVYSDDTKGDLGDFVSEPTGIECEIRRVMEDAATLKLRAYYPEKESLIVGGIKLCGNDFQSVADSLRFHVEHEYGFIE